jgi:hypothetical protein
MNIATQTIILVRISMKIHNPQVAYAYENQPHLRTNLFIRPADTLMIIFFKALIFYLMAGRINTASTVPMYWSVKIERGLRQQLAIAFRPDKRKRYSFGKYDRNLVLHIPHYNGDPRPNIPSYTVGQISAKIILTDQSSILIHAKTEAEAVSMAEALLKYVEPTFIPKEHVVHIGKRTGNAIQGSGEVYRAFRADFYPPSCQTPKWSVQL